MLCGCRSPGGPLEIGLTQLGQLLLYLIRTSLPEWSLYTWTASSGTWVRECYGSLGLISRFLIRHPNPSMHRGRVELLDIAYWTL